ncbi:alpha/beta hydrolase fold domain-containing protein [Pasteurellaceae bacterium 22721_9_1]
MSLMLNIYRKYLSYQTHSFISVEHIQKKVQSAKPRADISDSLKQRCQVEVEYVQERQVIRLKPYQHASNTTLFYLHGGAYVNDLVPAHWQIIEELIKRTGATVIVPIYRPAPYGNIDTELPFVLATYQQYCQQGCYFVGDSAGAGLALALAIELRNQHQLLPKGLFLFSPWLDVTMTHPYVDEIAPKDPMLGKDSLIWCGQQWAGKRSTTDPQVSPIYDELSDLPPMHIYQGTCDMLFGDVEKLSQKIKTTNTPCKVNIFDNAFHVFIGIISLPESQQVFDDVAKQIRLA